MNLSYDMLKVAGNFNCNTLFSILRNPPYWHSKSLVYTYIYMQPQPGKLGCNSMSELLGDTPNLLK